MKDVIKIDPPQDKSKKHKKHRKINLSFYYFLVFMLVAGIGSIISLTVLFKTQNIVVNGKTPYETADIIEAAGIKTGDNLIRLKSSGCENSVLNSLTYIESIEIKKKFPDTVIINVTPCTPYYNVMQDNSCLIVSRSGKILDKLSKPIGDLIMVNGFESETVSPYQMIKSADSQKLKILQTISSSIDKNNVQKIISVDIKDKYDIKFNYDKRITIEVGTSADIDYKLSYAGLILTEKISSNKEGYLIMNGSNDASFINKSDMDEYRAKQKSTSVSLTTNTAKQ